MFGLFFIFVICLLVAVFILTERASRIKDEKEKEERERLFQEQELARQQEIQRRREELEHLLNTDPEAYFESALTEFIPCIFPDLELEEVELSVAFSSGILGIEMDLPSIEEVGSAIEDLYVTRSGSVRANFESSILPKEYENRLYRICLRTVSAAFEKDIKNSLQSVLFNGFVTDYRKTTGRLERRLIMSLLMSREQFNGIDVNHVDSKACFKSLKGVSAAKLVDQVPITPVLQLNKDDHRFIESKEVKVDQGTNLASMPWDDFEQLVRDLFEAEFAKNGGEVKVTQASRDGGVDAVVFDPDPLRGGKIVIQAKRYTNTVPVSAVRDLYGTVINEGANTGILITTADYGPDSYEFAKDKPLKLLNGGHLLGLMEKNGRQAYINLKEAKANIDNHFLGE